jgi:hypothetical protein
VNIRNGAVGEARGEPSMSISGYPSATSAAAGATINFHLSATVAGAATCAFERIGFASTATTLNLPNVTVAAVPAANAWLGFGWPAYPFVVPASWPSGLYRMSATGPGDGAPSNVLEFVVRSSSPGSISKIVLAVDFVTPQAYNGDGGKSLYDWPSGRGSKVSFNRTLGIMGGHPDLIGWLGANGYDVEYLSLVDLHTSVNALAPYQCLLFGPHTEYWSREMRDQVEGFVGRGGNVMSLSGNTCYRQVRFENSGRTLVCYKNAKADPGGDLTRETVAFAQPPVNRPPNTMLGVGWTHGAFRDATPPAEPYQFHFPNHWACAGAPLGAGNKTPAFMGYETDGCDFAMEDEGYPRVTGEEGTALSTVVLASADLGGKWHGKPGMATATLTVRHGMVFSASTTDWIGALGNPSNPAISHVTKRLLGRFKSARVFDWEDVGHANKVVAMAAVDSKLFAATDANVLWRRYPVLAEVVWTQIGHANHVLAMAGARGLLFAVTTDNTLWCRKPIDADIGWTAIGSGPAGLRAMCASGSMLYAIDATGRLVSRPASKGAATWDSVPNMPLDTTINAMTSYDGVLFASTSGNRLLRTGFDFVEESRAWIDIHHCNFPRALAVVDGMLFVATTENRLWWLDLRHGALDALSAET